MSPKITRREFIKYGLAIAAVAVVGGTVWRAFSNGVFSTGQGPAYELWNDWMKAAEEKSVMSLVSSAILAANPHNTQPWLFLVRPSRIDLFADTKRNMGSMDPYLREMYTGLGCALENLVLAADAKGYTYALKLMPDATNKAHVAVIDLAASNNINDSHNNSLMMFTRELYNEISHRHTNRGPYDKNRSVSDENLSGLKSLNASLPDATIFWFTSEQQRQKIGDLIIQATEAIISDREQSTDNFKWFRYDWQQIQNERDGITLDAAGIPSYLLALAKLLPAQSQEQSDASWLQATKDTHVATASAFGIVAVHDASDNAQRLQGGRLYQRIHLSATKQGLAMQPLNQLTERADRESSLGIEEKFGNTLRELIGDTNWQALMSFRIGYPTVEAPPSPRRSVDQVIVSA